MAITPVEKLEMVCYGYIFFRNVYFRAYLVPKLGCWAYRFNYLITYFPLVVTRGGPKKIDRYLKVSCSSVQFDMYINHECARVSMLGDFTSVKNFEKVSLLWLSNLSKRERIVKCRSEEPYSWGERLRNMQFPFQLI